jgi:hypothetical protein
MESKKMETVSPPVSPPRGMWGVVLVDVVIDIPEIPEEIHNPPQTPPLGPPPMSPQTTPSTLPPPSAPPSRKAFLNQNKNELFLLLNSQSDPYTIFKPYGSIFKIRVLLKILINGNRLFSS